MNLPKTTKKLISIGIAPHDAVICLGVSPHGLISIGAIPHGLVSIGLVPMGVFSLGLVSMGLFSTGMVSMGFLSIGMRHNMSVIEMNSNQVSPAPQQNLDPHHHHQN
jgi:hypothetical protein